MKIVYSCSKAFTPLLIKSIRLALASMPAKVDLYGFDFGLTPTYYNAEDFTTPHDYDYEGVFVRKAEKEGQLKIY